MPSFSSTVTDNAQATVSTISMTVTGTDPCLVVGVSTKGASITHNTVAFNGSESFTKIQDNINGNARSSIWVLENPTATTANVVITLSGSSRYVTAASLFTDVDDTTPVRTSNSANGTNNNPSTSLTAVSGDLIIDNLCQVSAGPDTATASHTQRYNLAQTGGGTDTRGAGQTLSATGGSDTMDWSMGDADNWAIGAVALRAPFAGPTFQAAWASNSNGLIQ